MKKPLILVVLACAAVLVVPAANADAAGTTGTITIGGSASTTTTTSGNGCVFENSGTTATTISTHDADVCLGGGSLVVKADQGDIVIVDALTPGSATPTASLTLTASGSITETSANGQQPAGTITCSTLTASAANGIALASSNSIGQLDDVSAGNASGIQITNGAALTVGGAITTTSGAVDITTTSGLLTVGQNASFVTNNAGVTLDGQGVTVNNAVNVGTGQLQIISFGAVQLNAAITADSVVVNSNGDVTQSTGSTITANILDAEIGGAVTLTAQNQIKQLFLPYQSPSDFSLTDAVDLTVPYTTLLATVANLTLTTSGALSIDTAITATGNLTLQGANGIAETANGALTSSGVTSLAAPSGAVTLAGANRFNEITGSASGSFLVTSTQATTVDAITASSTRITTGGRATVAGAVAATSGDLILDAGSNAVTLNQSASLNAPSGAVRVYSGARENDTVAGTVQGSTVTPGTEFVNSATEHWNETSANTDVPAAAGGYRFYYANTGTVSVGVSAAPSPGTYGTPSTITATVTPGGGSGPFATPTGNVSFTVDGNPVTCAGQSSVALSAVANSSSKSATAACTTSVASGSAHPIVATYQPDDATVYATNTGSTSYDVSKAAPSLALANNPTGSPLTGDTSGFAGYQVTATVSGVAGASTPAGTVTFSTMQGSNPSTLCDSVTVTNGSATCTATLPTGVNTISASYSGDGNYTTTSATEPGSVEVDAPPVISTTALSNATVGQDYSANIAYTAGSPNDDSVALTAGALPAGVALAPSGLLAGRPTAAGSYNFTATVSSASRPNTSHASRSFTFTVQPSGTVTMITLNSPGRAGQPVTLKAAVSPVPNSGTVTFSDGSTAIGNSTVGTNGVAELETSTLAAGPHTITATYSGSTDYTGSHDSGSLAIDAPPTITTTSLPVGTVDSSYSATITVADGYPAGATVTVSGLPDGLRYDTASGDIIGVPTHSGDTGVTVTASNSVNLSSSVNFTLSIGDGSSSTVLTLSPTTVARGEPVTASVSVEPRFSTGTVQFLVDGARSGSPVALSAGAASTTIDTSALEVDGHTVTALFSGTADYGPSQDHALLTIDDAVTTTTVAATAGGLSASVTSTDGTPTGFVDFTVDGRHLGVQGLDADGVARLPRSSGLAGALTGETHAVRAAYLGADQFAASTDALSVTAPRVDATRSGHRTRYGWWNAPVTVRFTCTARSAPTTCPAATVVRAQGRSTVRRTVVASDGGTTMVAVPVAIDRSAPTVSVSGAVTGHAYRSRRTLHCHASDAVSGVASCRLTVVRHGNVVHWTATALDRAGNVTRDRGSYRIER